MEGIRPIIEDRLFHGLLGCLYSPELLQPLLLLLDLDQIVAL
jgi:hypothetical protein